MMDWWQFIILAVVGFIMAVVSGIAGAGGGFVMTPLMIALGLTPAQAVSSGKISGLMMTIGSLGGLRHSHERVAKRRIAIVMVLAFVTGLVAPFVIQTLDGGIYRIALGLLLLAMVPVVLIKKVGVRSSHPGTIKKMSGYGLLSGALMLQGIFSGGLGTLVNVVLMGMLGMTALEANITKRWSQLVLNSTIIIGVIMSGLIVWQIVYVMIPTALAGSYLGAHIAVKKGNALVMNMLVGLMIVSGLYLIFVK